MNKLITMGAALLLTAVSACSTGNGRAQGEVTEVVVYRVKAAKLAGFKTLSGHIHREARTFPGFISIKTVQSAANPNEFMDIVRWKTKRQAMEAFKNFPKLPHAAEFMAALDGKPVYAGHFGSDF